MVETVCFAMFMYVVYALVYMDFSYHCPNTISGGPEKTSEEWLEFLRDLGTNPGRQPVEV